ncbi:MAG TPA: DNA repair protein RecO [Candidatus Portnoybacteria bacterium]|uniref:DNA repair protein RecO n=1 Tax=Candidatus Portnoybacteria bacterium CG02_land_8_20_14_3_00_45_8 TaxID=1974807 RepID=A0A2M7D6H3_9BACT|nr:MAG: DNA repair protein RecO [Candidatus Portnoybacteria bacterium CG02_land_8_20_14_3_00_45_8]HCX27676.1 DNA repair protein RecO [Candidatus Portnoybacteria bacterium]
MLNKLPVYKTEGIIIKAADLGELDRVLTIYTRGHGKIQVRAISARKKTAKLNGLLQSFTSGQFLLAKSKTLDIITDVAVMDSYVYLRNNLSALAYAYYFAELVDKLVVAPERDDNLWRLISRAFEVLNQKRDDLSKIRLAFENKLVEFLGHPSLNLWMASHPSLKSYGLASHPKPVQHGKGESLRRLTYLQSLAGERLNSYKFLAQVHK